jgi:hypothetical protein
MEPDGGAAGSSSLRPGRRGLVDADEAVAFQQVQGGAHRLDRGDATSDGSMDGSDGGLLGAAGLGPGEHMLSVFGSVAGLDEVIGDLGVAEEVAGQGDPRPGRLDRNRTDLPGLVIDADPVRRALGGLGALKGGGGALASYLLFEPAFVQALIALGQQDAYARKQDLLAFFGSGTA